ncbi:MAG: NFACT RNA binding domain-containing protein [Bacilli bacterium]|nr:NFACT RNA binding domain-containing protein [Bacilli bacterium]
MSFDGVFIKHLLEEMKIDLLKQRVNRIHSLDRNSFVFSLSNRHELLIDLHSDSSHLRFTEVEYVPTNQNYPLFTLMKKNLEGARIQNIEQVENDRIVIFHFAAFDELGFPKNIKLILELFGGNSNLFLLDEENIIIDCLKKSYLFGEKENRINHPKIKYCFPDNQGKINPYKTNKILESNRYQGVSSLLFPEIRFQNQLGIIHNETKPTLFKVKNKYYFYCFNLEYLKADTTNFSSLSKLLENYYLHIRKQVLTNSEQKQLENLFQKEISKTEAKLKKQIEELRQAETKLNLEKIGNLLSANLHLVQKGDSKLEVDDFYHPGQKQIIPLNSELSPAKNLENIFGKYKKAKRAIIHLEEQIEITKNEIRYWQTLSFQLENAEAKDIREIFAEVRKDSRKTKTKKPQKPQITTFKVDDSLIMVGKNNLQNNYLTHTLAKKDDYFFHVKNVPGSHTILRSKNITPKLINLAAMIAAYFSKSRNSSQVPVDYTKIRNVKKVPKTKGSFVTYTHYQTVYVTPDYEFIKNHTN